MPVDERGRQHHADRAWLKDRGCETRRVPMLAFKRLSITQAGSHSRDGLSEQLAHARLGNAEEHGDAP